MLCIPNYKLEILQIRWKKNLQAPKWGSNQHMYLHMDDSRINISN